ncbi:MAG: hypothetical protein ACOVQM_17155, partial [Pirellula sp.]
MAFDKGISISDTPLFLVLGTSHPREVKSLSSMMGIAFDVEVPSNGPAPLSFYASERGIFLFLTGCNCISRLSTASHSLPVKASSGFQGEHLEQEASGTIDASHLASMQQFKTMRAADSLNWLRI